MQTYQRLKRKKVAEINVVPYIDVMLVLLIIFMAVTPVITQGSRSTCPRRSPSNCRKTKPPFIVSVNTEGEYVIKAGEADDEPVPSGTPRGDAAVHHREGHGLSGHQPERARGGRRVTSPYATRR